MTSESGCGLNKAEASQIYSNGIGNCQKAGKLRREMIKTTSGGREHDASMFSVTS